MKPATLAFAAVCLLTSPASASTFDAYFGFGDSTIDSGWWAGALNGQCGQVTPSCTTGNSTKDGKIAAAIFNGGTGAPVGVGQMSSQDLAADFGLTATPANQPNGTNYAISGALSARAAGYGPFQNPAVQYGNLNPNANLPSTVEQIQTYLGTHFNTADPNAIYEISSGGNDRTYANDNFSNFTDKKTSSLHRLKPWQTPSRALLRPAPRQFLFVARPRPQCWPLFGRMIFSPICRRST